MHVLSTYVRSAMDYLSFFLLKVADKTRRQQTKDYSIKAKVKEVDRNRREDQEIYTNGEINNNDELYINQLWFAMTFRSFTNNQILRSRTGG